MMGKPFSMILAGLFLLVVVRESVSWEWQGTYALDYIPDWVPMDKYFDKTGMCQEGKDAWLKNNFTISYKVNDEELTILEKTGAKPIRRNLKIGEENAIDEEDECGRPRKVWLKEVHFEYVEYCYNYTNIQLHVSIKMKSNDRLVILHFAQGPDYWARGDICLTQISDEFTE